MKDKHYHKWRRAMHPSRWRTPKVFDDGFYICNEPDCNVKKRFSDIFKKYALCNRCNQKFLVGENDWTSYEIICPACSILEKLELEKLVEHAPMVELADTSDLKSDSRNESEGSNPSRGTKISEGE